MIRRVTMRGGAGSCVDWIDQQRTPTRRMPMRRCMPKIGPPTLPLRRINQACRSPVATAPMASPLRWPVVFDLIGLGDIAGRRGPQVFRDLGAVDPRRQFQAKFGLRTQKARVWHGLLPIRCDSCFDTGERVAGHLRPCRRGAMRLVRLVRPYSYTNPAPCAAFPTRMTIYEIKSERRFEPPFQVSGGLFRLMRQASPRIVKNQSERMSAARAEPAHPVPHGHAI